MTLELFCISSETGQIALNRRSFDKFLLGMMRLFFLPTSAANTYEIAPPVPVSDEGRDVNFSTAAENTE